MYKTLEEQYEERKHLFPVKAEFNDRKGELQIRYIKDEDVVQIIFAGVKEEWEDLEKWYQNQVEGKVIIEIHNQFSDPVYLLEDDDLVEVDS